MNCYSFEEIFLGQTESFSVTITEEMMRRFYEITGDCNPLHTKRDFAQNKGYSGVVVYGMLSASFLSSLAGVYLPGENCIIHETDVKFPAPVYIGDTLTYSGKVISKNDTYKTIELKVTAVKSDGTKAIRGKMKIGMEEQK